MKIDLTTPGGIAKVAGLVVGGVIVISAIFNSYSSVENGHVGFRKTMGNVGSTALNPGAHWKWPFVSEIVEVNTQVGKSESKTEASSKDLQPVHSSVAVNYVIDKNSAYNLLTQIGLDFDAKIIQPHVEEIFKEVTAKYSAEELISKRDAVASETSSLLKARLATYDISVRDISIMDFGFSDAFNQSIEQKQIAAQNAMKAQNDLDKAKIDAQQQVVQAESAAQAAKTKADADLYVSEQAAKGNAAMAASMTPGLVDWKFLNTWNGQAPSYWGMGSLLNMLPSNTPAVDSTKK